jgi:hypothetical protein
MMYRCLCFSNCNFLSSYVKYDRGSKSLIIQKYWSWQQLCCVFLSHHLEWECIREFYTPINNLSSHGWWRVRNTEMCFSHHLVRFCYPPKMEACQAINMRIPFFFFWVWQTWNFNLNVSNACLYYWVMPVEATWLGRNSFSGNRRKSFLQLIILYIHGNQVSVVFCMKEVGYKLLYKWSSRILVLERVFLLGLNPHSPEYAGNNIW